MSKIRFALDLSEESEIGRFQYLVEPKHWVGTPAVGTQVAIDPKGKYQMEVVAVTASYADDRETQIVWGYPRFSLPLESQQIWEEFGFRPAYFERFDVDGETLTAAQVLARIEATETRSWHRAQAKNVLVGLGVAVAGTALYEAHGAGEHLLQLGWDEVVQLFKALYWRAR